MDPDENMDPTDAPDEDAPKDKDVVVARPVDEVREQRGDKLVAVRRNWILSLQAFRRRRMDRILGVLGVIVLVVALILLFTWENPPEEEPEYPISWQQQVHATDINATGAYLYELNGSNPQGPPGNTVESFTFTVTDNNVTRVDIRFTAQDDVGNPQAPSGGDTFEVVIQGPEGANASEVRTLVANISGLHYLNVSIALNDLPAISKAPVDTAAEAQEYVDRQLNATSRGMGEWTITVRMLEALDAWADGGTGNDCVGSPVEGPVGGIGSGGACTADDGNDFEMTVEYFTYYPTFPPPAEEPE